jgi:hypothetical protein
MAGTPLPDTRNSMRARKLGSQLLVDRVGECVNDCHALSHAFSHLRREIRRDFEKARG